MPDRHQNPVHMPGSTHNRVAVAHEDDNASSQHHASSKLDMEGPPSLSGPPDPNFSNAIVSAQGTGHHDSPQRRQTGVKKGRGEVKERTQARAAFEKFQKVLDVRRDFEVNLTDLEKDTTQHKTEEDTRLRDRLEETEKDFRRREIETYSQGMSIRIAAEEEASQLMQEYRQAVGEFEAEFKAAKNTLDSILQKKLAGRQLGKWRPNVDRSTGQTYYINKETGESQWEPPPPDTESVMNCGICLDVIDGKAVQCQNRHTFCQKCINELHDRTASVCPICRVEMSRDDPLRNLLAEQMASAAREESKADGTLMYSSQQILLQYKKDVKVLSKRLKENISRQKQILDAKFAVSRREFESRHGRWVARVARDRVQEKTARTQIQNEHVEAVRQVFAMYDNRKQELQTKYLENLDSYKVLFNKAPADGHLLQPANIQSGGGGGGKGAPLSKKNRWCIIFMFAIIFAGLVPALLIGMGADTSVTDLDSRVLVVEETVATLADDVIAQALDPEIGPAQARIATGCDVGFSIRSVLSDGSVECVSVAIPTTVVEVETMASDVELTGYTADTFDAAAEEAFIRGLAASLGVNPEDIQITGVADSGGRRRERRRGRRQLKGSEGMWEEEEEGEAGPEREGGEGAESRWGSGILGSMLGTRLAPRSLLQTGVLVEYTIKAPDAAAAQTLSEAVVNNDFSSSLATSLTEEGLEVGTENLAVGAASTVTETMEGIAYASIDQVEALDRDVGYLNTTTDELWLRADTTESELDVLLAGGGPISDVAADVTTLTQRLGGVDATLLVKLEADALNGLETDVANLQDSTTALEGDVATLFSDVATKAPTTDLDAAVARVGDLETGLGATNTRTTSLEVEIVTLAAKTRVGVVEDNVATLGTEQSSLGGRVGILESEMETVATSSAVVQIEKDIENLGALYDLVDARVVTVESTVPDKADKTDLTSLTNRVGTVETRVTSVENGLNGLRDDVALKASTTSVDDVSTTVGVVQADLTTLEGSVGTLQTEILTKATVDEFDSVVTTTTDLQGQVDGLDLRLTTAEGDLTLLATVESLNAVKSDITTLSTDHSALVTTVTTMGADVDLKATDADLKVVKQDVFDLGLTVTGLTDTVDQHTTSLATKASQDELDLVAGNLAELETAHGNTRVAVDTLEVEVTGKASNDSMGALISDMAGLQTDMGALQVVQAELEADMVQTAPRSQLILLQDDVAILTGNHSDLVATVGVIQATVATKTAQADFLGLEAELGLESDRVTSLEGRMDGVETALPTKADLDQFTVARQDLDELQGNHSTLAVDVGVLEVEAVTLSGRIATLEGDFPGVEARVTTAEETLLLKADVDVVAALQLAFDDSETATGTRFDGVDTALAERAGLTDFEALQVDVSVLTGSHEELRQNVTALEVEVGLKADSTTVAGVQAQADELSTNYIALLATTDTLDQSKADQVNLAALETEVGTLSSSLSTLDGETRALEGVVATKSNQTDLTATLMRVVELESCASNLKLNVSDLSDVQALKAAQSEVDTISADVSQLQTDTGTLSGSMGTAEAAIVGLEGRVTILETTSDSHGGRLDALETDVALKAEAVDLVLTQADVAVLQGNATDVDARVGVLEVTVPTLALQADHASLDETVTVEIGRLDGVIVNVATKANQTDLLSLETTVTDMNSALTQADSDLEFSKAGASEFSALVATVEGVQVNVTQNQQGLEALVVEVATKATEADLSLVEVDVGVLQGNMSSVDARVVTLEEFTPTLALQADLSSVTDRVTVAEGTLVSLDAALTTGLDLKTNVVDFDVLDADVADLWTSHNTLSDNVVAAEADILTKAAESDLTVLVGNVTTLKSSHEALTTTVSDLDTVVGTKVAQTDFDALAATSGQLEVDVAALQVDVATKADVTEFQAVGVRVGTLETTVDTLALQGDLTALDGRVTTAETTLINLDTALTTGLDLKTNVVDFDVLDADVVDLWTSHNTLSDNVVAAEADILTKAADSDLTVLVGNVTTLKSSHEALITTVSDLDTVVGTKVAQTDFDALAATSGQLEVDVAALQVDVATKADDTEFQAVGVRVGTLETTVETLALQGDLTALDGRVTTAETTLINLDTALTTGLDLKTNVVDFDVLNTDVVDLWSSHNALSDNVVAAEADILTKAADSDLTVLVGNVTTLKSSHEALTTTVSDLDTVVGTKVAQTDFDALAATSGQLELDVAALQVDVATKADDTEFQAVGVRVGTLETTVETLATQADLTTLNGSVTVLTTNHNDLQSQVDALEVVVDLKADQTSLDSTVSDLASLTTEVSDNLFATQGNVSALVTRTATLEADTITGVSLGSGLSGGGTTGDVSVSIQSAVWQTRVDGTCPQGSSIRVINEDGSVTCDNLEDDVVAVETSLNSTISDLEVVALEASTATTDITSLTTRVEFLEFFLTPLIEFATKLVTAAAPVSAYTEFGEGVAVAVSATGAVDGSYISLLPSSVDYCTGAISASKFTVASSVFTTDTSLSAGTYKVCHALAAGGADADTDFWDQGRTVTVISVILTDVAGVGLSGSSLTANVAHTLTITGASEGDFIALVSSSLDGCVDAPSVAHAVDASAEVVLGAVHGADTYRVCYAAASTLGDAEADFWDQGLTVTVEAAVVSSLVVVDASPTNLVANLAVPLVSVGASEGDFLAVIDDTVVGCTGAASAPLSVAADNTITLGTSFGAGSYKVCYAPLSSSGNTDSDFQEQGLFLTFAAATLTAIGGVNAADGSMAESIVLPLAVTGGSEGDFVGLLDSSTSGCGGAPSASHAIDADGRITTGTGFAAGTYKLCYATAASAGDATTDYSDQGVTLTLSTPTVSAFSPLDAYADSFVEQIEIVIDVTGASSGDFVGLVSTSSVGCVGASAAKYTVSGGVQITTLTDISAGSYRLCYASSASLGDADTDFWDQGLTVVVISSLTSVSPTNAATSSYEGVVVTFGLSGASAGDYISLLASSASGCTGASGLNYVVSSDTFTTGTTHSAGGYKICHADAASGGGADSDFREQSVSLTVSSTVLSVVTPVDAFATEFTTGVATPLTASGASSGDFVSILDSSVIGCLGASSSQYTVDGSGVITTGTGLAAGSYKVCYADSASGGGADADFSVQTTTTVVALTLSGVAPVNAASGSISVGAAVTLSVTGGSQSDYVALVGDSTSGCGGAPSASYAIDADGRITTGTGFAAGTYKLCYATAASAGDAATDYYDQGVTLTLSTPTVLAFSPLDAYADSFVEQIEIVIDVTGASSGDFVGLVSTSSVGCVGASAAKYTVSGGVQITTLTDISAGNYRLCYANSASLGDADTDFWDQAVTVTAVAALSGFTSVNAASTLYEAASVTLDVSGASDGDFIGLASSSASGCTGASSVGQTVASNTVVTGTSHSAGVYKLCHADASSSGNADSDFREQGLTVTLVTSVVSSVAPTNAATSYFVQTFDTSLTVTGASSGDYISILASSVVGCLGADSSQYTVDGSNLITTGTGLSAGTYKTCYATSASGGNAVSDFTDQGQALTVTAGDLTGLAPVNSNPASMVLGIYSSFELVGGAVGDFVSFLGTSTVGCAGAAAASTTYTAGSSARAVADSSLNTVGAYKVCWAGSASGGNADTDFAAQFEYSVIDMVLDSANVTLASAMVDSRPATLSISGAADTIVAGDWVALASTSSIGCLSAGSVSTAVSSVDASKGVVTTSASYAAGTYKLCHALAASGGGSDSDFWEQSAEVTVAAATVTVVEPVNAATGSIVEYGSVYLSLTGASANDWVGLVSSSTSGCDGAESSPIEVDSSSRITTPATLAEGTYKVCYATNSSGYAAPTDFSDQAEITVIGSEVTSITTTDSSSNVHVSVTDVTQGDFVAILLASTVGCLGASSSNTVITTASHCDTPRFYSTVCHLDVTSASYQSNEYKVCYAPAASLGDADSDFRDQSISISTTTEATVASISIGSFKPVYLSADSTNNRLYISDSTNSRVFLVDTSSDTTYDFVTSGLTNPTGIAYDSGTGDIWLAQSAGTIKRLVHTSATAGVSNDFTLSSSIGSGVTGLTVDPSTTTLYVSSTSGGKVYSVTSAGTVSTLTSDVSAPIGLGWVAGSSSIYVAESTVSTLSAFTTAGVKTVVSTALLDNPQGLAVDETNSVVYVTDVGLDTVVKVGLDGATSALTAGGLDKPKGVALHTGTNVLYMTESNLAPVYKIVL